MLANPDIFLLGRRYCCQEVRRTGGTLQGPVLSGARNSVMAQALIRQGLILVLTHREK